MIKNKLTFLILIFCLTLAAFLKEPATDGQSAQPVSSLKLKTDSQSGGPFGEVPAAKGGQGTNGRTTKAAEFFANQNGDDLLHLYTDAIKQAKFSVLLIVYSLTDANIINCLKESKDKGVAVKVICDAEATPLISSKLGKKVPALRRFGPGLMHQKILVIDRRIVLIGSANMTKESLKVHGNLVVKIENEEIANDIWTKALSIKRENRSKDYLKTEYEVAGQKIELWFLPDNPDAVEKIKTLIRSAKKTIRVAMFTWTRTDLAQEIICASKLGIDAKVAIDYYSAKGASAKVVKLFKENGIPVYTTKGGPLLHHKFMCIDSSTLVEGSANWTKRAFTENDDCFLVIHRLKPPQVRSIEQLWNTIQSDAMCKQE